MTSDRFDPNPDEPYGHCSDCRDVFDTEDAAEAHMGQTFMGGSSHRIRVTNPIRARRIESEVSFCIDTALNDLFDELIRLVDNDDATEAEIAEALRWGGRDLDDAWVDWLAGDA